jgi:hypothetical protein
MKRAARALLIGLLSLPSLYACDEQVRSDSSPSLPTAFEGDLKGKAIVKIQDMSSGKLAVLAETLKHQVYAGAAAYVHDHARSVYLKQGLQWQEIALPSSLSQDSFVTDIASVRDGQHLLISAVKIDKDNALRHVLLVVAVKASTEPLIVQSLETELATFPELEGPADKLPPAVRYLPHDTLNVGSLALDKDRVTLAARNSQGSLYVDTFRWQQGRLESQGRLAISPPVVAIRVGMTGGSYDVMGQLISKYRVHSKFLPDGRLVIASSEFGRASTLAAKFGQEAIANIPENAVGYFAMLSTLSADGRSLLHRQLKFWGSGEDPIHGLVVHGAQDAFIFGSDRDYADDQAGRASLALSVSTSSDPQIFTLGEASASAHTALCPERKTCVVAGSWRWTQNPEGLSISGGDAYLGFAAADFSSLDVQEPLWPDILGSGRSEVRDLQLVDGQWVCAAGMMHGPDTHMGDGDVQRIVADGFIRCLPLSKVPNQVTQP